MTMPDAMVLRVAVPKVVRRNTILLAAVQCVAWLAIQMLVALGALIAFRLTASQSWSGLPITLFVAASALAAPYAGRLMDRAGRRPVLMVGQAAMGVGSLITGVGVLYGSFAVFLVGVVVLGMSTGIATL